MNSLRALRFDRSDRRTQEYADATRAAGDEVSAAAATQVRHGLLRAPCDVVQEPTSMADAARRIGALIPPRTPFTTLEAARDDLEAAAAQLERDGVYEVKGAHGAEQGAAAEGSGVMGSAAPSPGAAGAALALAAGGK